jgi:nitrogen fixation/metabolism regulation signal transduction histidine kinase
MTATVFTETAARDVPRSRFGMTARTATVIVLGTVITVAFYEGLRRALPGLPTLGLGLLTVGAACPAIFLMARKLVHRGLRDTVVAVSDGLLSLTERDYTLRLAVERKDEVGLLIYRFNKLAESLRREHNDVYQREILLETVLGASSMIAVICNEAQRIIYSNTAARQFFADGKKLEGMDLGEILGAAPDDVRRAAESPADILFTCDRGQGELGEPETFHLSKRFFELSSQKHTLFLLRPLTKELARKEIETWKKAIRVLGHEINNSLAPVTSLVHSARMMIDKLERPDRPDGTQRLRNALDTIEERARHLKVFLDSYASFARLPLPSKRNVAWKDLFAGVEGLYSFRLAGPLPAEHAFMDPAQMQQVLINLLKNAAESGSAADEITVEFSPPEPGGVTFHVADRGKGMSEEVMRNALLPFYSTKKAGAGIGLALCREILEAHGGRLSLHPRDGGGLAVRCWLPEAPSPAPT